MNSRLTFLLTIAAATVLLFGSCKPKEEPATGTIELSTHEVTVAAEGGSISVDVTSSNGFSVTIPSSSKWISANSKEDTYSDGTITFTAEENTNTENRTGIIIFKCLEAKDTLTVIQEGAEDLYYSTFMGQTEPGIYGQSFDSFTYQETTNQYAVTEYSNGQSYDYRIMATHPDAKYVIIKGIPTSSEVGGSFSIGVQQNVTSELSTSYYYTFKTEKISGNKIWMYCSTYRFGVITTTE